MCIRDRYKKFLIAMAFAVGLILFKTIRNYNVDVFHDNCEDFVCHNVQANLEDSEWVENMFAENGPRWEEIESFGSQNFRYTFALLPGKHICSCQPRIVYSPDRHYRAVVWHTHWEFNFFKQKHEFCVYYEDVAEVDNSSKQKIIQVLKRRIDTK